MTRNFARLRAFLRDRRAAAAIEFAFVAPVLLVLYMATLEVSLAIDTNKKLARTASLVGDLVTQQQDINKSELEAIMRLGDSLLNPYDRTRPSIEIDAITIDGSKVAKISWSRKYKGGAYSTGLAVNTTVTVPEKLKIANTFLIAVRSTLNYSPLVGWFKHDVHSGGGFFTESTAIDMRHQYYLRPRVSASVSCANC